MSQNNELLACYRVLSLLETASANSEKILDNMSGAVLVLNQKLQVIRTNQEFAKLAGHNMETILGFDFTSLFSPENKEILLQQLTLLRKTRKDTEHIDFELEITLPNQDLARQFFWHATLASQNTTAEGDLISISGKDLSELYQSEMKLKSIFGNLPVGMLMLDATGMIKEVLSQYSEVLFDRHDLVGQHFASLIGHGESSQDTRVVDGLNNFRRCFGQNKKSYTDIENTFPKIISLTNPLSQRSKWLSINYQPILKDNLVSGFILLIEDATETINAQKEMERVSELERQINAVYESAIRDPLSGLYTRLFMRDSVKSLVNTFHRGSIDELAILMLDIDYFKQVNDTYGHSVGDNVIREVGRIISDQIRESDIAIRYGGEEFLIILPSDTSDLSSAKVVADRIRQDVADFQFELNSGHSLKVTISGGGAWFNQGENMTQVIERADSYLYQAKRSGKNKVITEGDKSHDGE